MAEVIRMPKMSDTMEEGVIAEWHKKVGDEVKSGDILAEVETDKATMDMEAYQEGTLLYIGVEKGDAVPVNGIMAVIGEKGEDYKGLLEGNANGQVEEKKEDKPAASSNGADKPAAEEEKASSEKPAPKAVKPAASNEKINATLVRMPKMSDTMEEGVLVSWQKKVGDKVASGDILAEVETDKATMDLEAYEEGTLLYAGIEEGDAVPINAIIAVIGEEGANFQALIDREEGGNEEAEIEEDEKVETVTPSASDETKPVESEISVSTADSAAVDSAAVDTSTDTGDRLKASPLARRLAEEKGIDLKQVAGSGDNGRIVKRDVDEFKPAAKSAESAKVGKVEPAVSATAPAPMGNYEDIPVSQMRKTISRRLSESMFTAPHFYLTMEINMDKAMALRPTLNEVATSKISFNDFVVKACALALKQHPKVNSAWLGDKIRKYDYVNIGIAVAVDEGLLVPVVRDADKKTLSTISAEVKDFAGRAKDKKLQPKDWEGNTFSISNLGMFGIDEFTAIINPPDACILAIGSIKQTAAFKEDGTVYPTNVMKVTLSCDHRVVDGVTGSEFLQTVKKFLEAPMSMLV